MIFFDDQGEAELRKFLMLVEKLGMRACAIPEARPQAMVTMKVVTDVADQLLIMAGEVRRGQIPNSDMRH